MSFYLLRIVIFTCDLKTIIVLFNCFTWVQILAFSLACSIPVSVDLYFFIVFSCLWIYISWNNKWLLLLQARSVEEKCLWSHHIKRLILENHNAIVPQKVKDKVYSMYKLYTLVLYLTTRCPFFKAKEAVLDNSNCEYKSNFQHTVVIATMDAAYKSED